MPASSSAFEFFRQVRESANPPDFLSALVGSTTPTFETEWLDFKGADKLGEKDEKRIWSKALSGFANSGGGVIVFGIDARPDAQTQIDCAGVLALSPARFALKSRLLQLHGDATNPPVQGIEVEAYPQGGSEGPGFVVCYIPDSPDRPHRAEHDKRFYIRAGDDFHVASVSLLRSLFFPHAQSRLVPEVRINPPNASSGWKLTVFLKLHNTGTATAHDAFLIVRHDDRYQFMPPGYNKSVVLDDRRNPYYITLDKSLHPGLSFSVLTLYVLKGMEEVPRHGSLHDQGFWFEVFVYSRDAEPFKWHFTCSYHELNKTDHELESVRKESILYPPSV